MGVFQYTRHKFGRKDSPTWAIYAFRRTAVDNQDRYIDAAYAALNSFHKNLGFVTKPKTTFMLSRSLTELLKLEGFNLSKFVSLIHYFSLKLNPSKISPSSKKKTFTAATDPETASLVHGLILDHGTGMLVVSRAVNRSVLIFVSPVFDPIGLVAPYTVLAHLFLENIFILIGQLLDDPLPNELYRRFIEWHSSYPFLGQLTISNYYFDWG